MIIAVIVLLSLLVSFVDDIDRNVNDVWDTATRLAANTATTWRYPEAEVALEVGNRRRVWDLLGSRSSPSNVDLRRLA